MPRRHFGTLHNPPLPLNTLDIECRFQVLNRAKFHEARFTP
jgi:hypothetical protein